MKIEYKSKRFHAKSLDLIEQVNKIIKEYAEAGYDLTVRMLYYQCVARDLIPNTTRSYKNFGSLISDARMAGLIDWNAIVDRTRVTSSLSHWEDPKEIIRSAYISYNIDHWKGQTYRPRVWIEKDALSGVIMDICEEYDVPFLACRGYMSQSAMWRDSQTAIAQKKQDYKPIIIHLGDHDPSGIDMTRDIGDRMVIFGADYEIRRIALNYDQIEEKSPPPNPTKISDSRANDYIDKYGVYSWELDALEPNYINGLLRDTFELLIDKDQWNITQKRLKRHKVILEGMTDNYSQIVDYLTDEELI